ncbi:MAG: PSD1 domain-containing protein [Akkermansiaceae bacterium]|nr:PSD1 domain-containing protein [Akkermansiaceae bacterium]
MKFGSPVFAAFMTVVGGGGASATLGAPVGEAEVLFARRVWPLLQEKCTACHGEDEAKRKGGLDLGTWKKVQQGGESGLPGVVPGKAESSPLYLSVTRAHEDWEAMPPKENDRLEAEQIGWIKAWIEGGAPWLEETQRNLVRSASGGSEQEGETVVTSGGLSGDWTYRRYKSEDLWAYRPVASPIRGAPGNKHPIDAFLEAPPSGASSLSAPPADKRTLLRRITFDLTGLPPTPEEMKDFFNDPRPDPEAWNAVIERLLASPRYGEHWARHWLDVVRYADTSGFANDFERGNAWRYRDWVVRAFNADMPYDRFVRLQIAGDEISPGDPEAIIATGFLRMGPWELTGMEVAKIARQRFLDDVTNSVGETFLGHSLQCARCHDHKFDPVPTRDYYSIQAVFATTQIADRRTPFAASENVNGFEERQYLLIRQQAYESELLRLNDQSIAAGRAWLKENHFDPAPFDRALKAVTAGKGSGNKGSYEQARVKMLKEGVPEKEIPPKLAGFSPQDFGGERVARKGLERLQWELERYEPFALAVYDGLTPQMTGVFRPLRIPEDRMKSGEREQTAILAGGDPFAPTVPVRPGGLTAIETFNPEVKTDFPQSETGRRRALAEWIAHPKNPLTSRVIANRIWAWHFGQPLAGNPNNFGSTGKKPTHPELLDWLAGTMVAAGWSMKTMHRLILSSQAYQRAAPGSDLDDSGEAEALMAAYRAFRPRRLTAEELRDAMLQATGELNPEIGGIPNRPEINPEAAFQPRQVMGTFAAAWVPNPLPSQRHRRSLYGLRVRGLADPFLEVFNEPAPDFSCERREVSTITPQVFALFNGLPIHQRALALAARSIRESGEDSSVLRRVFDLALGRPPTPVELESCLAHWHSLIPELPRVSEGSPMPTEIIREAVEENTGEKFTFREILPSNQDFVPDLQADQVDARTRALADICLILFNSNEFAYLY